jgi:hypothetical protein
MSADDQEEWYPYAITTKLPDDFGYSSAFIKGDLKCGSTATTGSITGFIAIAYCANANTFGDDGE